MSEIKVQVCVYAFDLLYLNGKVQTIFIGKLVFIIIVITVSRNN